MDVIFASRYYISTQNIDLIATKIAKLKGAQILPRRRLLILFFKIKGEVDYHPSQCHAMFTREPTALRAKGGTHTFLWSESNNLSKAQMNRSISVIVLLFSFIYYL